MGLLHDSLLRTYKTDIETNSTIDAEASQDKQDISELLNALSQFLNGIAPLVQEGVLPFDIAKIMLLLTISRRFNFGSQLEDALNAMQAPPPKSQGPSPEDQAKMQVVQAQSQAATAKAQQDMQMSAMEHQQKMEEAQVKAQLAQMEMANKEKMLHMQAAELDLKAKFQEETFRLKMATAQHKAKQDQKRKPANASV